jgi:hypothetical protein
VHTVEVSNGHSAAADNFGQVMKIAQQFHDINLPYGAAKRQPDAWIDQLAQG